MKSVSRRSLKPSECCLMSWPSKKQTVRAIKPVDQDVASTVEIEVTSGEYHFVYSKTFNKTAQTTLNVLAPKKKQVTGREAHMWLHKCLARSLLAFGKHVLV